MRSVLDRLARLRRWLEDQALRRLGIVSPSRHLIGATRGGFVQEGETVLWVQAGQRNRMAGLRVYHLDGDYAAADRYGNRVRASAFPWVEIIQVPTGSEIGRMIVIELDDHLWA